VIADPPIIASEVGVGDLGPKAHSTRAHIALSGKINKIVVYLGPPARPVYIEGPPDRLPLKTDLVK